MLGTTLFFGERWDAPAVDDATQVATPVGASCLWCDEEIVDGDRGFMRAAVTQTGADLRAEHRECGFRAVVGSIGHLLKVCHCYGGTMEDPPGITRRQSALLVWAWVRTYGMGE